jgi:hypothetical protein
VNISQLKLRSEKSDNNNNNNNNNSTEVLKGGGGKTIVPNSIKQIDKNPDKM